MAYSKAAGGIRVNVVRDALKADVDILVVGRAVSKDVWHGVDVFTGQRGREGSGRDCDGFLNREE